MLPQRLGARDRRAHALEGVLQATSDPEAGIRERAVEVEKDEQARKCIPASTMAVAAVVARPRRNRASKDLRPARSLLDIGA